MNGTAEKKTIHLTPRTWVEIDPSGHRIDFFQKNPDAQLNELRAMLRKPLSCEIKTNWVGWNMREPQRPAEIPKYAWMMNMIDPLAKELTKRGFTGSGTVIFRIRNGELSGIVGM